MLEPHVPTFAAELARTAFERGLAVTTADGRVPIPITGTPVVVDAQEIRRRVQLTTHLASAGAKMARAIVGSPDREKLLRGLGPIERQVVERSFAGLERLAITRVDYFVSQRPMALELNATIPAMPGYSDIAADTFIEVVGRRASLSAERIAKLKEQNGSNTRALYDALLDGFRAVRGRAPERLGILVRRQDSQLSEIEYLRDHFRAWGTATEIVYPDEVSFDGASELLAQGKRFDFIYRHLFVKRLEKEIHSDLLVRFLGEQPHPKVVLFNPPAAHIETKTNFALLSESLERPELAKLATLTAEESDAIRVAVPWSRQLEHGPAVDPDGQRVPDLVTRVVAEPDRFVLKRAWEYGGKAVFVGRTHREESFQTRVRAAYGEELPWAQLVERASRDPVGGGFIVQELVAADVQRHLICTAQGVTEAKLHVDYSAYASVGLEPAPRWGGVCRGSVSHIVNILGGGGVIPLLTTEVYEALTKSLPRSP